VNSRCCSRTACKQSPVYTLTYVYKDSTAVLGPLAGYVDPHGWDVVRLPPDPAQERADDLEALANIVRDVGRADRAAQARPVAQPRQAAPRPESRQAASARPAAATAEPVGQGVEVGRRGHLRVVRSAPAPQSET
jgi:hypothetical protein